MNRKNPFDLERIIWITAFLFGCAVGLFLVTRFPL